MENHQAETAGAGLPCPTLAGAASEAMAGTWRSLPRRRGLCGQAVGVLYVQAVAGLLPGNVQNASTFDFPLAYKLLPGVEFAQIASGDPAVLPTILAAARELQAEGVRAIVGACGSLGHYQRDVADSVDVPVFMSILTQLPFILQSLGRRRKLVVVFASTATYTALVREQCGIVDDGRIVPVGVSDLPGFRTLLTPGATIDPQQLAAQFGDRIASVMDADVAAIMLQCSDLPPFAAALQTRFGLPVFDVTGLLRWLQHSTVRRPFSGWM